RGRYAPRTFGVAVGVSVIVGVSVMVGVSEAVGVSDGVGVSEAVGVSDGVGDSVAVGETVSVGVLEGVTVAVVPPLSSRYSCGCLPSGKGLSPSREKKSKSLLDFWSVVSMPMP